MTEKQIIKKEISRIIKRNTETVIFEVHNIKLLTDENQTDLIDFYQDEEDAYFAGLYYTNDELCNIDNNVLLKYINQFEKETQDDATIELLTEFYNFCKKRDDENAR